MLKHTESDAADVAADLAALREDIAHLVESVEKLTKHRVHGAGFHVSEVLGVAGAKDWGPADNTHKHMRMAARGEFEASMERSAVTGLAVAFSIGLALGVLIRLRR